MVCCEQREMLSERGKYINSITWCLLYQPGIWLSARHQGQTPGLILHAPGYVASFILYAHCCIERKKLIFLSYPKRNVSVDAFSLYNIQTQIMKLTNQFESFYMYY